LPDQASVGRAAAALAIGTRLHVDRLARRSRLFGAHPPSRRPRQAGHQMPPRPRSFTRLTRTICPRRLVI
jgi:hypothetical protein